MTRNQIRNRLMTACLVAMLLPGEAVLAQSLIAPSSDFDVMVPWDLPSVSPGQATAAPNSERWSRNTFVLFRTEATRRMGPIDVSPSTAAPATAEPATAPVPAYAIPVPGTVQNLRRAEQH
jgi:hypothetical protein